MQYELDSTELAYLLIGYTIHCATVVTSGTLAPAVTFDTGLVFVFKW
jgi:hypothetical protein